MALYKFRIIIIIIIIIYSPTKVDYIKYSARETNIKQRYIQKASTIKSLYA